METNLSLQDQVTELQNAILKLPQCECPTVHRFGPGIYIREALLPQGAMIIGAYHKSEHVNYMLSGAMMLLGEDGTWGRVDAPMFFVGKPGRKVAYILQDVIWQNIYATTETDLNIIESMFIDNMQPPDQNLIDAINCAEVSK